jgi:hypothetical protein
LDSFNPAGCYNILCETNDTADSKRVNWIGSHDKNGGNKVSSKAPFYLSGASSGAGCTKLATSCANLNINIQAARAPAPGVTDLSLYTCSELSITCKSACFTCPGKLIATKTCPTGKHECACPANQVLVGDSGCECKAGTEFKDGKCVPVCYTCPGELIQTTTCPTGKHECACPANQVLVGDSHCECKAGTIYKDGQCVSACPYGQKLDGSGYCVHDWCHDNYICPYKSHRASGKDCYNDFDDCTCEYGYYKFFGFCKKHFWCFW